jgi:hypothetical protein
MAARAWHNEVLVETDEGWGAMVGPKFGCVLWEASDALIASADEISITPTEDEIRACFAKDADKIRSNAERNGYDVRMWIRPGHDLTYQEKAERWSPPPSMAFTISFWLERDDAGNRHIVSGDVVLE